MGTGSSGCCARRSSRVTRSSPRLRSSWRRLREDRAARSSSAGRGVGKTALARRFADSARATASRVLVGECTEIEARRPLGPFLQIVEDARRSGLIRVEDAQRVAPMPQGEIDASTRPRLYQGLVRIFAGIARTSPLVLVIEDLHWADEATLGCSATCRGTCGRSASPSSERTGRTSSPAATRCARPERAHHRAPRAHARARPSR